MAMTSDDRFDRSSVMVELRALQLLADQLANTQSQPLSQPPRHVDIPERGSSRAGGRAVVGNKSKKTETTQQQVTLLAAAWLNLTQLSPNRMSTCLEQKYLLDLVRAKRREYESSALRPTPIVRGKLATTSAVRAQAHMERHRVSGRPDPSPSALLGPHASESVLLEINARTTEGSETYSEASVNTLRTHLTYDACSNPSLNPVALGVTSAGVAVRCLLIHRIYSHPYPYNCSPCS